MNATVGSSGNATGPYMPWPYAVRVEQTAVAGVNVPTCVGPQGQVLGDFSVQDASQECGCVYTNAGL